MKTKNDTHSHSAGFEAWMRGRGDANRVIGVDDIVDVYGVVRGSYDEVSLPKISAFGGGRRSRRALERRDKKRLGSLKDLKESL